MIFPFPALFSFYLDGFLNQLRKLGIGCQIGGCWYGVACFADDLVLLALVARSLDAMILKCCAEHAYTLEFSTDPDPKKVLLHLF